MSEAIQHDLQGALHLSFDAVEQLEAAECMQLPRFPNFLEVLALGGSLSPHRRAHLPWPGSSHITT